MIYITIGEIFFLEVPSYAAGALNGIMSGPGHVIVTTGRTEFSEKDQAEFIEVIYRGTVRWMNADHLKREIRVKSLVD